jgi:hypothetical protein
MSNYSAFERSLAHWLARFPIIKNPVKRIYQRIAFLLCPRPPTYSSAKEFGDFENLPGCSFFGYYDKSPENKAGLVLAQYSDYQSFRAPSSSLAITLVVTNKLRRTLIELPISAYNWQQGCRAHWLTAVSTGAQVKVFSWPVQDSFGKEYFVSLNYERLMALRPDYGYRNLPTLRTNQLPGLEKDGLWRVDFATGETKLLVSLADACAVKPLRIFKQATHKFNHAMVCPNGKSIIFLHRYVLQGKWFDRLLIADANTGEVEILSDYGMVSHCCWADERTILAYSRGPGGVDGYWQIDVPSGGFVPLWHEKLKGYGDGHPHVYDDWVVTDTYPDKSRMQHLLLFNWKTGQVVELGRFFHGFKYTGESRCDLHPRFAADGDAIYFDSVFSGRRRLYRMPLLW